MRLSLPDNERAELFAQLADEGLSPDRIAAISGVSPRTVSDWKRGKYTIPLERFERALTAARVKRDLRDYMLKDWWHNQIAGKKGAAVRTYRHGVLGTTESRRRGGRNSYALRKDKAGDIFSRNAISIPQQNELLAECVGILIGDGNVTKYQVSAALSALVDADYSLYVKDLLQKLFGISPTIAKRKSANCLVISVSSIELVEFLRRNGVLQGHKIGQNLDIPAWILGDSTLAAACLRGVFDTDGCVFQEVHRIKGITYGYPRWSLVSASPSLRASIYDILLNFDLNPKIRNNRSVNLEFPKDITRYFRIIGTSNPKHLSRFRSFGGVG